MENHNGVWTIETKDMTTGQSTVLKVQTQETLSVYYISLETYSISQCSDYPTGSIPYSELALRNQAGQKVTPTWNADRIDPAWYANDTFFFSTTPLLPLCVLSPSLTLSPFNKRFQRNYGLSVIPHGG
jgi:hypothetical protein